MKLYDGGRAPNPRRVRIYLAEKGIDIPMVPVDMGALEHRSDEVTALNPFQRLPVLVLDDGTVLTETIAICRYLEELHPEPPLFGTTPLEKARIMMWDRRVQLHGFDAVGEGFRNSNAFFKDRALAGPVNFPQIPALAERAPKRFAVFLKDLDTRLAESPYVAGEDFSIADITALATCDFARTIKMGPPYADLPNLQAWYEKVSARPSAKN